MDDAQRLFWVAFRASLIQEAKTLQDMRAAKLAIAADVKRLLDAPAHDPPKETPVNKT
jgi:hypothetical protein